MFKTLGYGLGNTALAAVAIVIGVPTWVLLHSLPLPIDRPNLKTLRPILFWKFGERIRNASHYALKTPSIGEA